MSIKKKESNSAKLPVSGSAYPSDFKHVENEWYTDTHHHWLENFIDEDTGEIIQIKRRKLLFIRDPMHFI